MMNLDSDPLSMNIVFLYSMVCLPFLFLVEASKGGFEDLISIKESYNPEDPEKLSL